MTNEIKKELTNIEKFFRELSRRMYKENDLSDMVYALCRSNPGFMQFFLDFVFGDGKLVASEFRIEREVSFGNDRPDFVMTKKDNGERYFIEVKIGDRNHHFSQYCSRLNKLNTSEFCSGPHLGYITNYYIDPDKDLAGADKCVFNNCCVHTWKEFKEALSKTSLISCLDEDVKGLLAYCEMVCPTPFADEPVNNYEHNSENFKAIKIWYEALESYLNKSNAISINIDSLLHGITIKKYRVANTPAESIGIYFEAQDVTENISDTEKMCNGQKIWGWAGWLLTESFHPGFCIAFDNMEGWGAPVFKRLNKHEESWLSFCYDFPVANKDVDDLVFSDAFKDVCERIITGKGEEKKATAPNKVDESLYAARKLPLYLRQQVFPRLSCVSYRIEPFPQKDSFNPKGWCGEYFAVKTNPRDGDDSKQIGVYWVGTYFDGNQRKDKDGNDITSEVVCEKIGGPIVKLTDTDTNGINTDVIISSIQEFINPSAKTVRDEMA